ncbi:MAG: hypothetical protein PUC90_09105 [Prevotella sp.]|nr:hypothetical protein [Prevotella sp.]
MKKIFTLVAVALSAISANAQTESWNVNNTDGTLKTDYKANTDESAMSVVSFSTTNVTGTHTSGPIAGYEDGPTTPLKPKVDNSWGGIKKQDLSSDGSVPSFYYVQGKGNPVNLDKVTWEEIVTDEVPTGNYRAYWNDSYYNPDGTAGLPKNGTYITLKATTDGKMRVAVWIPKNNRDVYIAKASDFKALSFGTDVIASGYINGQNNDVEEGSPLKGYPKYQENIATKGTEGSDAYVIGPGNQAVCVYLTFIAKANENYYIFNKNTQIGFSGFEFTPGETTLGINSISNSVEKSVKGYYTLDGAKVNAPVNGITIVKYSDGTAKKVIK